MVSLKEETILSQDETTLLGFINPLKDWVFSKSFISMPYYGPSLHVIFAEDTKCATPTRVKGLLLSIIDKSLLGLEYVGYAHMDIRSANIVLSDREGWSDARLIDFDFCQDAGAGNPMNRAFVQYPPEEKVHKNSDVWMLGIILLQLNVCGTGWTALNCHSDVEFWVKAQLDKLKNGQVSLETEGFFEGALRLAAQCLIVNPGERINVPSIREAVALWVH
ncbi:hypothetical protein BDR26DRAFT_1012797 [Obelidium mucronatum]|nr:hypothetical protein BDR26DRAFT_1012797 [Obelidium mucronatum]